MTRSRRIRHQRGSGPAHRQFRVPALAPSALIWSESSAGSARVCEVRFSASRSVCCRWAPSHLSTSSCSPSRRPSLPRLLPGGCRRSLPQSVLGRRGRRGSTVRHDLPVASPSTSTRPSSLRRSRQSRRRGSQIVAAARGGASPHAAAAARTRKRSSTARCAGDASPASSLRQRASRERVPPSRSSCCSPAGWGVLRQLSHTESHCTALRHTDSPPPARS